MQIVGHRGAPLRATENTRESVSCALQHGVARVEVDVRRTGSGSLVCAHDPDLGRLGGPPAPLIDMSDQEVRAVRLDGGERVLFVDELLEEVHGRSGVILEVKNDARQPDHDPTGRRTVDAVGSLLQRAFMGQMDDVVISSFDERVVRAAITVPGAAVALLTGPSVDADKALARALELAVDELHPHHAAVAAQPQVVEMARCAGLRVVCWTVNSVPGARSLRAMGVDGVITDDPATLLREVADA